MKHYYVKYGYFRNEYQLMWVPFGAEVQEGWERIPKMEAINLCRQELYRRKHDSAFSGYASEKIYPMGWESGKPYKLLDSSGFVVLE